jgi:hypothetical protein
MNYFEKLFLSTTLLFGIVIFFLFGLYFDMGDMFSSSINKSGVVTRGAAIDRLVDNLDKTRRIKKVAGDGSCSFGHVERVGTPSSMTKSDISRRYDRYFKSPVKKGEQRVEQYKAYLLKQGFSNPEYIEMKALAQDQTVLKRCMPVSRKLSASGDFEEAIAVLEDALNELPVNDSEQRLKITMQIVQLCLRGGFLEKARDRTEKQIALESRILNLEAQSKLMEKKHFARRVQEEISSLDKKRSQLGTVFASLEKRKQETGKLNGLLSEEKVALKAEALGLKSKGEISGEVYSRMLKSIE